MNIKITHSKNPQIVKQLTTSQFIYKKNLKKLPNKKLKIDRTPKTIEAIYTTKKKVDNPKTPVFI